MKLILAKLNMQNIHGEEIKGHWDVYRDVKDTDHWMGHITKAQLPDPFNVGVKFWPSRKYAKDYGMNIESLTLLLKITKKIHKINE
jgi:hypothetical protein